MENESITLQKDNLNEKLIKLANEIEKYKNNSHFKNNILNKELYENC